VLGMLSRRRVCVATHDHRCRWEAGSRLRTEGQRKAGSSSRHPTEVETFEVRMAVSKLPLVNDEARVVLAGDNSGREFNLIKGKHNYSFDLGAKF